MTNAIETKHLTKAFGGLRAVDDLSIAIPHGVTTGLIGPNGSGKTTLMNLLTGLHVPDCGEIIPFADETICCASACGEVVYNKINPIDLRKLKIARTFQDGRLVGQLSVCDNLLLAIAKNGACAGLMESNAKSYNDRVNAIMAKINLTDKANAAAESLSYGQRKLLELGRAMIQDAEIYLLDEPFTGLFPAMVEQGASLLEELKSSGKTLVIIEHNISLTRRLADNIIVLDHGQLLASGTPEIVLKNKQVQEAYLGV
ncbi:ABC transporter ATP-binding protein [Bacteroidia bacterium]|nr:ABC transporter ATP-binding protein [Bacteroidia bacterium]